jgi:TnpA family transposase
MSFPPLVIEEIYTDTAGFTDHVFALCHVLGTRFAPRIRDLPDKKLYTLEPSATYTALTAIIGSKSNVRVIEKHWDNVLRLACSIKSGVTTASLLIRKIAAQHTSLSIALRELGRIERTLFILDYLEQPKLRLKILMGLNKGEARMRLRKPCFSTAGVSFWTGRGSSNPTAPAASIWSLLRSSCGILYIWPKQSPI